MSIANCKQCGKLFKQDNAPICPGCQDTRQQKMHEVYQYIQAHPGISITQICRRFDLTVDQVEQIVFSPEMGTASLVVQSECSGCKKTISVYQRAGKFCVECSKRMVQTIREEQKELATTLESQQRQYIVDTVKRPVSSEGRRGQYGFHRSS